MLIRLELCVQFIEMCVCVCLYVCVCVDEVAVWLRLPVRRACDVGLHSPRKRAYRRDHPRGDRGIPWIDFAVDVLECD